jgi:cytochrome c oxidase subunit II
MRDALAAGLGAAALASAVVVLAVGIRDGSGATGATGATTAAGPPTAARPEDQSGRTVFVRMGCGSCHTLAAAGSAGSIGPDLDERLGRHTRESLIARITAAPSATESFSAMPTDFASRMSPRELDALVSFLLAAR